MSYRPLPPPDQFDDLALQIANLSNQIEALRHRLEVPRFDGKDTRNWIFKITQYFISHATPEEERVTFASFYFDGAALAWYQWMYRNNQITSWAEFLCKLQIRFPSVSDDSHFTAPLLGSDLEIASNFVPDYALDSFTPSFGSEVSAEMIAEPEITESDLEDASSEHRRPITTTSSKTIMFSDLHCFSEVSFTFSDLPIHIGPVTSTKKFTFADFYSLDEVRLPPLPFSACQVPAKLSYLNSNIIKKFDPGGVVAFVFPPRVSQWVDTRRKMRGFCHAQPNRSTPPPPPKPPDSPYCTVSIPSPPSALPGCRVAPRSPLTQKPLLRLPAKPPDHCCQVEHEDLRFCVAMEICPPSVWCNVNVRGLFCTNTKSSSTPPVCENVSIEGKGA